MYVPTNITYIYSIILYLFKNVFFFICIIIELVKIYDYFNV